MINVFTLAEKGVLLALLKNALGWAPEPTFGPPFLKHVHIHSSTEQTHRIMQAAYKKGIRIRAAHIFKPLCESRFTQYNLRFHDDAMDILRKIVKDFPGMLILDYSQQMQEDLEHLRTCSPPLYDKVVLLVEKQQ